MAQQIIMGIRPSPTGTASNGTPQAAQAFVLAALPIQAGHAGVNSNAVGIGIFTDLFLVLIAVSVFSYIFARILKPCAETGARGYSPFSQLSEYTLGWFAAIYYWIYPGITAVTIVYGLIKLIITE